MLRTVFVSLLGFVCVWLLFPVCWLSRHHQPIGNWLDNVVSFWNTHFFAEVKFSHNMRIASTYSSHVLLCVYVYAPFYCYTMIYWQCHFYYIILSIWFRLTSAFSYPVHCVCMASSEFQIGFLLLFQIVCLPYKVRIDCEKFHHRKNSFKAKCNWIELK